MTSGPIQSHHDLWQKIGNTLLERYRSMANSSYLDSGVRGRRGEGFFRTWLSTWLPQRVSVLDGVIVSMNSNPSTQRDVVLFDTQNCPVFQESREGGETVNILPIEGVLGSIEVNDSAIGKHKLLADFDKLSSVKKLESRDEPPKLRAFGKYPDLHLVQEHYTRMVKLTYVFARDSRLSLATLARHLVDHNLTQGVDASVDGICVLEKGCILHGIEAGWTTSRIQGSGLFFIKVPPWEVLLNLVAMVNHHLALGSRGCMPEVEEYFSPTGSNRRDATLKSRTLIGPQDYLKQPSTGIINVSV